MSEGGKAFIKAFGKPDPKVSNGLVFKDEAARLLWNLDYEEIGAGWFMNRFLYLFGAGLERLRPCLDAWSFLVPKHRDRMIVGHNAHGAILVLDDANSGDSSIHVLDPFLVEYWGDANMHLGNMFGYFLPRKEMRGFEDDSVYKAWTKRERRYLLPDMILAPKTPLGLGGEMKLDNFQEENIFEYYKTTAPIYKKALSRANAGKAASESGKKAERSEKKPQGAKKKAPAGKGKR